MAHKQSPNPMLENASVASGGAEQIEADDESFDYVVATLVCCSVTDLKAVYVRLGAY